jgi:hypothetical protein
MHVPWGWIKQRPHFLAEQLNDDFEIRVMIAKSFKKVDLTINKSKIDVTTFFKLPFDRFKLIRIINIGIVKFLFKYIYAINKYQYIWITDLRLYPLIENIILNNQRLIYDCMDDILEFKSLKKQYNELEDIEKKLFKSSDLILFSSKTLQNRKIEKYNISKNKFGLIYNALDKGFKNNKLYHKYDFIFQQYKDNNYTIITYIGTVSDWFDFDLLKKSLKDFDNIVYFIIGPIEKNIKILKHQRIKYFGAVEHSHIKSIVLKSDILIMPFKINKLIEAVDPVKMYEYITFGKVIISVQYDELIKFYKYLNLYNNYSEFKHILNNVKDIKRVNILDNNFLELNTWESRKDNIISFIDNIF